MWQNSGRHYMWCVPHWLTLYTNQRRNSEAMMEYYLLSRKWSKPYVMRAFQWCIHSQILMFPSSKSLIRRLMNRIIAICTDVVLQIIPTLRNCITRRCYYKRHLNMTQKRHKCASGRTQVSITRDYICHTSSHYILIREQNSQAIIEYYLFTRK